MRTLFSLALIGLCFSLTAQETINYPYNPDGDVDGTIASPDLLDILGVYGNAFTPTEIQIDGVGLLEVIQDLQNQVDMLKNANEILSTYLFSPDELQELVYTPCGLTSWSNIANGGTIDCYEAQFVGQYSNYQNNMSLTAPNVYFAHNAGANITYNIEVGSETQVVNVYAGSGNGNVVNVTYFGTPPTVYYFAGSGNITVNLIAN